MYFGILYWSYALCWGKIVVSYIIHNMIYMKSTNWLYAENVLWKYKNSKKHWQTTQHDRVRNRSRKLCIL